MLPKFFAAIAALAVSTGSVAQAKVCFRDVREFEAVRTSLPTQLRSGTIYAIHKSFAMKGGFKVVQAGSRFVIEAKGKSIVGQRLNETSYIKIACFEGDTLAVLLDDGRKDAIKVVPLGFKFHGLFFKLVSADMYNRSATLASISNGFSR